MWVSFVKKSYIIRICYFLSKTAVFISNDLINCVCFFACFDQEIRYYFRRCIIVLPYHIFLSVCCLINDGILSMVGKEFI